MLFSLLYVFWDYLSYFDVQMTCKNEKKSVSSVITQYSAQTKWVNCYKLQLTEN